MGKRRDVHIKSKYIDEKDFKGDIDIRDFAIFAQDGPLADVERAWTATKELSLRLDRTQSDELRHLEGYLLRLDKLLESEPGATEDYIMASDALETSRTSHALFVPAIIFILQISFFEFAIKRICHLVDGRFKAPSRGLIAACTGFLKQNRVIEHVPREFEE